MKLYLSVNKIAPQGYMHIDPAPQGNVPVFLGTFADDFKVPVGEVTDLIADGVFDLIETAKKNDVIKYWVNLLTDTGRLIITGKDLIEISKSLLVGELSTNEFSKYSETVKSFSDLDTTADLLKSSGLRIVNQKLTGHDYMVECTK